MTAAGTIRADAHTPRWGMVMDLNRCVGCQTCTIACKHVNDTPPGVQWRQVLDVEYGVFPDVERVFLPVGCQHCDNPPCVPVCPTGATFRRDDGIVAVDYGWCIGCGACAVACPYQARHLVHRRDRYFRDRDTVQEQVVAHEERLGVIQKCTFCSDRIDAARARGLAPGHDPEATPACASACIAQAIRFGDFNDPGDPVAKVAREQPSFVMHEELGARPMIRYLYETPSVPGRDADPADADDERMADPENPLVGKRQRRWDARAAANFICGGVGSGMAIAAYLAHLAGSVSSDLLPPIFVAAGAIMAVGLFAVFLEIGRKLRFVYALRRPQSSWMTREVYVVAVFYPAVAAVLLRPVPAAHALVVVAATAFLYCQARILHASRGIPAWRVPLIPWMLAATGLFEGLGALVLALAAMRADIAAWLGWPMTALAGVNAGLWHAYRTGAKAAGVPPLARAEIARVTPPLHALGHGVPFVGAIVALVAASPAALIAAGIGAIAGGALWKYWVIVRASYQQGFALPRLPQRGSGRRSAWAGAGAEA
jgi:phenylacetyl-CoA:acceptor oxidoreductase subunit 1